MSKLIERERLPFGDDYICQTVASDQDVMEKLYEYEQEEEDGLLVRLPCKIGDTSFWISEEDDDGNKILTIKETDPIDGVAICSDGFYIHTEKSDSWDKIGSRYALLTQDQAEQKLKEMEVSDEHAGDN